jgi:hypothetical protein
MYESIPIIAFDQHAASVTAAVLLPGHRTPALHQLSPDLATIGRFVERVDVIAQALIPRRPGDRIKTDRRDAGHLAVLYRAGTLTAVHIPTEQEEAARDLLRCREDIRADLLRARHRLSKFLLRHGRRFTGTKKAWSKRHEAWLRAQTWPLPGTRTARICGRSTKPSPASARSKQSCAIC